MGLSLLYKKIDEEKGIKLVLVLVSRIHKLWLSPCLLLPGPLDLQGLFLHKHWGVRELLAVLSDG